MQPTRASNGQFWWSETTFDLWQPWQQARRTVTLFPAVSLAKAFPAFQCESPNLWCTILQFQYFSSLAHREYKSVHIRELYSCLNLGIWRKVTGQWLVALCSCDAKNTILKSFLAIRNWASPAGSSGSRLQPRTSVFLSDRQTEPLFCWLVALFYARRTRPRNLDVNRHPASAPSGGLWPSSCLSGGHECVRACVRSPRVCSLQPQCARLGVSHRMLLTLACKPQRLSFGFYYYYLFISKPALRFTVGPLTLRPMHTSACFQICYLR